MKGYAMSKFNEIDVKYLKEYGLRHDILPTEWQKNVTKCLWVNFLSVEL